MLQGGCGTNTTLERFEFTRLLMGVQTRIVLYSKNADTGRDAASEAFTIIARLDDCMSDYRAPDGSELMRLCAAAGGPPLNVSDDLLHVLEQAQRISLASDGAFDVTVGPLVALWREARRTGVLPAQDHLQNARDLVGWKNIIIDESSHSVQLLKPSMKLDLGGIGKGYAAQRAVDALRGRGITRCLVALAGDIAVGDPPPGQSGWSIAAQSSDDVASPATLLLANAAVSTSGDSEQFIEIAGQRYGHIVNPRTGLGLTNRVSATVIAPRGELADALSTAVCVMGLRDGQEFLAKFDGVAAILEAPTETKRERAIFDPHRIVRWELR